MARLRETKTLKPIDNTVYKDGSESPGRNGSERKGGPESEQPRKPSLRPEGEGSMSGRKLAETLVSFRRGDSGGMVARTRRATGEALLVPGRNAWRKVGSITSDHWEMS